MLSFDELRRREFARLDAHDHVYLDYTGSALYAMSQIRAHQELLAAGIFGNPHSDNTPSRRSTRVLDEARALVLAFFDVDDTTHDVIFTANTSAAIKLVAEGYPFMRETRCVLAMDNHNSVNGIREYARRAGAAIEVLPLDEDLRLQWSGGLQPAGGLLAFPAQSNFSGLRHPLSLVSEAKSLGYDVLLDIAAFAPSHRLSLRECPADYAALSFYKLFGYPTGLGALIVRREALAKLTRPWFAGGTVTYASVGADTHRFRPRHEGFEDGTPDFLSIAALPAGFAVLEEVGMSRLSAHVARLTARLLDGLSALPGVQIYGRGERGGAIAFNIDGVPYWDVETRAREAGIALRGGCFCNPGASEAAFGLGPAKLRACFDTLGEDFTVERFADCAGVAVGAVRVSVGLANNDADVARALDVIERITSSAWRQSARAASPRDRRAVAAP
jgi:selenocysteine lyase/cysteine desulfurase